MKLSKVSYIQNMGKAVLYMLIFVAVSTLVYFSFDIINMKPFVEFHNRVSTNISHQSQEYEVDFSVNSVPAPEKVWNQLQLPFNKKCFLHTYYNSSYKKFKEEDPTFLNTAEKKKFKTILVNHCVSSPSCYFGFGKKPFAEACCREKNCFMTARKDVLPLAEFDAILFNYRGLKVEHIKYLSKSRYLKNIAVEKSKYGHVYPKSLISMNNSAKLEDASLQKNLIKGKSKIAAWFVSNCKAFSERELYVQQLQKYIQVDVYGNCGSLKCSRKKGKECYKMLERKYKFYLSYENSLCTDYITEKFFRALNYYIVPVVLGSGNYDFVAPPHSFIDVRDFRSELELAKYLLYLDKNHTAYMEYFRWKQDYFALDDMSWFSFAINFCGLCEKLHIDSRPKVYQNLEEWFINKAKCKG
ncbi:Fatty-acid amide hydrolase 2 [Armadillidium vulgare]|nr:Fatty-acid amide hydrolase 2 [Armadillidium vulgare]